jgi:hypothetical protein
MFEHARICHETQKSEHAGPRQSDRSRAIQLFIQPVPRGLMLIERIHMGVDEDIGVDQDHLQVSPSAMASGLGDIAIPAIRSRPSATDRVRMVAAFKLESLAGASTSTPRTGRITSGSDCRVVRCPPTGQCRPPSATQDEDASQIAPRTKNQRPAHSGKKKPREGAGLKVLQRRN